jgi:hypothetical protein
VTIDLPNSGGRCQPVFSTTFRSADYVQVLLASGPSVSYLVSSALDLVRMLRDLESMGIRAIAIDRCPRCSVFTVLSSGGLQSAADLLNAWSIVKATEMARADLYLKFALESARAGELKIARDVALQTVGHVSLEEPSS